MPVKNSQKNRSRSCGCACDMSQQLRINHETNRNDANYFLHTHCGKRCARASGASLHSLSLCLSLLPMMCSPRHQRTQHHRPVLHQPCASVFQSPRSVALQTTSFSQQHQRSKRGLNLSILFGDPCQQFFSTCDAIAPSSSPSPFLTFSIITLISTISFQQFPFIFIDKFSHYTSFDPNLSICLKLLRNFDVIGAPGAERSKICGAN